VWARIEAPVLWVAGGASTIPRWLAGQPEGEGAVDGLNAVRARMASVPGARLAVIDGAGHMLHHDEPEAVARAIESFLDLP
jgi:pimeloyl-ACP methyl ester carboxylesterase